MKELNKHKSDGSMAIGGGTLLGLGVGFFLLEQSVLYFLGSLLSGLGIGLIVATFIQKR